MRNQLSTILKESPFDALSGIPEGMAMMESPRNHTNALTITGVVCKDYFGSVTTPFAGRGRANAVMPQNEPVLELVAMIKVIENW